MPQLSLLNPTVLTLAVNTLRILTSMTMVPDCLNFVETKTCVLATHGSHIKYLEK